MPHTAHRPNRPELPVTADARCMKTLRLLFELAQDDQPAHPGSLAARLGLEDRVVSHCLLRLEQADMVRADHCRLTMRGLVVATRLARILHEPGAAAAQSDAMGEISGLAALRRHPTDETPTAACEPPPPSRDAGEDHERHL